METTAQIGATVVIKGEVSAREDLTIAGRIEGTVRLDGHVLTISPGAQLSARVEAGTIIVSGTVQGDLMAAERIELHETAEIKGSLVAPRLRMVDGAALQGRVDMPSVPAIVAA